MRNSLFALALIAIGVPTDALADSLKLGEQVGAVSLETLDGHKLEMNNYDERPATAILFLSARCPVTEESIGAINKLYLKYRLRDVLYVGVCSDAAEQGDELRTFAQNRGLIFPVYRDADQTIAKRLGATVTPEVFLLDRRGTLVFHGGLDSPEAQAALEAAVTSVLKKQPVEKATSDVRGTSISKPGQKLQIDNPYGTISFSSELIFEKIPGNAVYHCSTLCEAANGDLLCLWYGGTYESADDQVNFLARRKAREKVWSEPQVVIRGFPQPPGNGVIFRDSGERLWIVWARMDSSRPIRRGDGWGRCQLVYRTSNDHGETWSEDKQLFKETVWCVPRNPPLKLIDGTLVLPVEGSSDGVEGSHFLRLSPGQDSWQLAGFTAGGSQPTLIQRQDGSLLALMRNSRFITQIESTDAGATWTKARPTVLKNPDAGISMAKLANGHSLLVFNDSQTDRTPLSLVRSTDDGASWETPLHLESNPGEYSYPCIIQTSDGKIHVSYTFRRYAIKHVELNENWLDKFERPD